jgi:DNA-binding NarL/FixJ family response regulator
MEASCVLLAEPHHGIAESTRLLLATVFDAVVMVADEGSLAESADRVKPCLVIVDLVLAKRDVAGLIARLRECSPQSKVILLSVHDERAVAQAVIDAGADGFLTKSAIGSDLIPAIEAVRRGERFVSSKP